MRSKGIAERHGPLAQVVRARRKALGVSQVELARLASVGPVFVYDVESGKSTLRLDKLLDLLEVLGLELVLAPGTHRLRTEVT